MVPCSAISAVKKRTSKPGRSEPGRSPERWARDSELGQRARVEGDLRDGRNPPKRGLMEAQETLQRMARVRILKEIIIFWELDVTISDKIDVILLKSGREIEKLGQRTGV